MFGLLPPSSSVSRLIVSAAEPHDLAARRRRAGERDLVDARVTDEVCADRRSRSRHDVDGSGREADLGGELGHAQRGQRRRRVGLQHDRAARPRAPAPASRSSSSAGSSRDDLARRRRPAPSASRRGASRRSGSSGRRSTRSPRHRSGSSRRPVQSSALTEEIALPTLRASSSASSLRFAWIASASACSRRERSVGGVFPSLRRARRCAAATARSTSSSPAERDTGERLAGRRLAQFADLARCRLSALSVDEEPVLALGRDSHRRGRYRLARQRGRALARARRRR